MIDSVWTSDHHPSLCGTAKFSHQLAMKLGVPLNNWRALHPLVSIRASERFICYPMPPGHDLFLHDWWNEDGSIMPWVERAERIYAANEDIAKDIRTIRPDVITLWAPSTIQGNPHRGTINVLTFGMAHKIQPKYYEKLKTLLDATGEDYTVSVSTAIHEGSPWDETAKVGDKLRAIFGDRLRVLGYLADDALVAEMARCAAVAIFYDPAFRRNNTSGYAVLERGKRFITNCDDLTPTYPGILNIDWMNRWDESQMWFHPEPIATWDELAAVFQEQPCAK